MDFERDTDAIKKSSEIIFRQEDLAAKNQGLRSPLASPSTTRALVNELRSSKTSFRSSERLRKAKLARKLNEH